MIQFEEPIYQMFITILIKGGTHSNNVLCFSALPPFWDGLHRQQKEGMRSYHAFFWHYLLSSISLPFECISRNWIINANININMQLNICFIKHNISWIATLPIEGQKLPFLPFFFFTVKNEKDVLQHAFISKFWRCSHHMEILEQSKPTMSAWLRFIVIVSQGCLIPTANLFIFLNMHKKDYTKILQH